MLKGEGSSTSCPGTRNKAAKEGSEAKDEREESEIENARRLDKLPQELWERIFDDLEENDLFPLALSCRYFRQKQKELVERTRQREPGIGKPRRRRLALKTNLRLPHPEKGQPASADYLWFCSKEKVSKNFGRQKAELVRYLAAFQGHLPLLQELQAALAKLDWDITRAAARGGQLETLQWLKSQNGLSLDAYIFAETCRGGNLEVLKWLKSEGCPWGASACSGAAAQGGHLEILKWLRSEGCTWDASACYCAARCGHLDVLRWLRSQGCPWEASICIHAAAGGGHLGTLKWLRSEGGPWDEEACHRAAGGGQFETLRWLRSKGCPWNETTCKEAARGGHLDVLQWLIDNGCPYEVNHYTREALQSLGLA